ncbi:hypothetical protein C8F01DRAFT_1252123 [Mycena amicta]|nr:hypothetical protein C8F01DRAFT_1252123 [Mycena amicta]
MDILPPELTDHTLDFLHDDLPSLRTCSLVCRAWVPASRFHLFQNVTLRRKWMRFSSTQCRAFLMLLESRFCTFPTFVTHLTLEDLDPTPQDRFHDAYPVLRERLPGLESITFLRWKNLGTPPLHKLLPHCTGLLTEIKLALVSFRHREDLFRFLELCPPSLGTLDIERCIWPLASTEANAAAKAKAFKFPAACSVKTLRLRYCSFFDILDHFVAAAERIGAPLQCSTLELENLPAHIESTGRFLAKVGPALNHLVVQFGHKRRDTPQMDYDAAAFLRHFDLRKNTCLQSFRLNTQATDPHDPPHILAKTVLPNILRSLAGHRLLEVVRFNLAVYALPDIDCCFIWDQLDKTLDGMNWLQRIEFDDVVVIRSVRTKNYKAAHDAAVHRITERLPRMAKRGCLIFP